MEGGSALWPGVFCDAGVSGGGEGRGSKWFRGQSGLIYLWMGSINQSIDQRGDKYSARQDKQEMDET